MCINSSIRSLIVALLLAALPQTALAEPPAKADIEAFKRLHGHDLAIAEMRRAVLVGGSAFVDVERNCLADGIAAALDQQLDRWISESFENAETLGELIAWSRTPTGGKFFAYIRAGVVARIDRVPGPDREGFRAALTADEADGIDRFIESRAGQASAAAEEASKGLELTEAMLETVASNCGIDSSAGR